MTCCAGAAFVYLRHRPPERLLPPTFATRDVFEVVAVSALIAGVALYSGMVAILKPVDEWDALMYHGPTVVKLVTTRSLFGWDLGSSFGFYPNLTAFMGAPIVAATQSTRFLDAVQIIPWISMVFVGWSWAGRGRPRLLPGVIVVFAATAPPIFTQLRSLAVDVTYASGLLAAMYCTDLWWSRRRSVYLAVGMICLAAAIATKPAGAILVAWSALLLLIVTAIRRKRHWVEATTTTVAAAALGAPIYLRNLLEFRNPAYPVLVDAGPIHLPGVFKAKDFYEGSAPPFGRLPPVVSFIRNLAEGVIRPPDFYTWDMRAGGYWLWPLWLAGLGVAGASAVLIRGRRVPKLGSTGLVVVVLFLVILITQPQSWHPRFTMAVFLLIAVAVSRVASVGLTHNRSALFASALLGIVGMLQLRHVEHHFVSGFGVVDSARQTYPGFGDTFGAGQTYGPGFAAVASAPCGTHVLVDANDRQAGRFSTFSLALWGDALCNEVTFVDQGTRSISEAFADQLAGSDLVVVDENEAAPVEALAQTLHLDAQQVAGPLELSGTTQVILQLRPHGSPAIGSGGS
jgi:hypothetical protein